MDEETRRRCLEPFFTTKGERGTGLGLAMVYGMVQRHSAEIEIESAPGHGTTVRLSFAGTATIAETGQARSAAARTVVRILIVDDDPLVLKVAARHAGGRWASWSTADGGQAGIDAFRQRSQRAEPFAVVITDLGMPYVDGRTGGRRREAASPSTPSSCSPVGASE